MKISDAAAEAILTVMRSKGLDPKTTCVEIGVFEGNLGMGFTREPKGRVVRFGELAVAVSHGVDATKAVVDFGEVNGKRGLIFQGESDVNNSN